MLVLIVTLTLSTIPFVKPSSPCSVGYYDNSGTCVSCAVVCYDCDSSGCTQCLASNHRYLYGTQCVPMDGYYESNQPAAGQCPDVGCKVCRSNAITNCDECMDGYVLASNDCFACDPTCYTCDGTDANDCTGCTPEYYLDGSVCTLCQSVISSCITCSDLSTCVLCQQGYFITSPGSQCNPCILPCLTCSSQTVCQSCDQYYELEGSTCQQICGDGVTIDDPCDLGPGMSEYGCTDSCQIAQNFDCQTQDKKSTCVYIGPINFIYNSFTKSTDSNQIQISVMVSPNLAYFDDIDFLDYLSLSNDQMDIQSYSFDPDTGELMLSIEYSASIVDEDIRIIYADPSNSTMQSTSSSTLLPIPSLFYYTQAQYQYTQFVGIFSIVLLSMGWSACLLAVPSRRLAGLQIMIVLQFCWFLLLVFPNQMQPQVIKLKILKYINGYNYFINEQAAENLPPYISAFDMSRKFYWENFNVNYCLYGIALVLIFSFWIAQRITQKQICKQICEYSQEGLMYICMLNLVNVISCTIIYLSLGDLDDIASYFGFALPFLITIGTFIKFWIYPDPFGRFRYAFKVHPLAFKHYYIFATTIIISVLLTGLLPEYQWSSMIVLFLYGLFLGIFHPYLQLSQNLRAIYFTLLMMMGIGFNCYAQYNQAIILTEDTIFALQGTYLIMIFLGIIWSFVQTILNLKQHYCFQQNNDSKKILELQQQLSQYTARAQKQQLLTEPTKTGIKGNHQNIFTLLSEAQKFTDHEMRSHTNKSDRFYHENKASKFNPNYLHPQYGRESHLRHHGMQIQMTSRSNPLSCISSQQNEGQKKESKVDQKREQIQKLMLKERKHFMLRESIRIAEMYGVTVDKQKLKTYQAI